MLKETKMTTRKLLNSPKRALKLCWRK